MNKFWKVLIAFMGATDIVFRIFTPIAVALMLITLIDLPFWSDTVLIVGGWISALYRAIEVILRG